MHALQNKVKYERKVHLRDHPDVVETIMKQMKEKQSEGLAETIQIVRIKEKVDVGFARTSNIDKIWSSLQLNL